MCVLRWLHHKAMLGDGHAVQLIAINAERESQTLHQVYVPTTHILTELSRFRRARDVTGPTWLNNATC